MKAETITVYCVESERGQTVARYFNRAEAQHFATEQQRLRGRCPADRLHVVPREFIPKPKPR